MTVSVEYHVQLSVMRAGKARYRVGAPKASQDEAASLTDALVASALADSGPEAARYMRSHLSVVRVITETTTEVA